MTEALASSRAGPAAERAAGAGEDHPLEVLAALAAQALRERGVLGVDRDEPLGLALDQVDRRARHRRPGSPCWPGRASCPLCSVGERRREPGRADQRVQDHVGLGRRARASRPPRARRCISTPLIPPSFSCRSAAASVVGDGHVAAAGTPGSGPRGAPGWSPADRPTTLNRSGLCRTTSSACVPTDPVEPRMIERAHRPKRYPAAPHKPRRSATPGRAVQRGSGGGAGTRPAPRTAPSRSGRARRRARAGSLPMSLIPRSRLSSDSARSPSGANNATTTASPTESPDRCRAGRPTTPRAPTATAITTSVAPIAPSHDFLGLMFGASGRLPQK